MSSSETGTSDRPPASPASSISWVALAMMTVGSVSSLRNAPTMAEYGLSAIFLYVLPGILFLLPTALVSAELASGWSGGVYRWVYEGVSPNMGLVAIWNQFGMTIFYYPTLLSYVASTLAFVFRPDLASSGVYTAIIIIIVYWTGVLVSLRGGIGVIAKLASSGLVIGTLVPGVVLVGLGVVFLAQGNPSAAPMTADHILPPWTGIASLVLIMSTFGAYSGMEMNAVHVSELRKPSSEFPKAMFVAMGLVLAILIIPPLAISWIVPAQQLSLTAGVMQAFDSIFAHFGLSWLTPVMGVAIVAASLAGFLTWLAGPSRGLLLIGREEGFIPPFFQKVNRAGVQQNILVVQGAVTTAIALMFVFLPAVSSAYWIFMTISTQAYLIVYFLMFIAAVRLRKSQPDHPRGFRSPALTLMCVAGFASSVVAFFIGFVPPSQFGHGSVVAYAAMILGGILAIGIVIPWLLIRYRKPSWRISPEGDQTRSKEAS